MSAECLSNLKVGDIKKFRYNGNYLIGIYLGDSMALLQNGNEVKVWSNESFKTVRLKSEDRKALSKSVELVKTRDKLRTQIQKLSKEVSKVNNECHQQFVNTCKGLTDKNSVDLNLQKQFKEKLVEKLYTLLETNKLNKLGMSRTSVDVTLYEDGDEVNITLSTVLDKYIRGRYPFLGQEYDGSLYVYDDTKPYKDFISKFTDYGLYVPIKCTKQVNLDVGDKDTLCLDITYSIKRSNSTRKEQFYKTLLVGINFI